MEKSFEDVLVQFYIDQYRENAKRSTGKPVKLAHYIHRLNSKAKSIKYARFSKNETVALDKLHQEIKRLALITYYSNNKNAKHIIRKKVVLSLMQWGMTAITFRSSSGWIWSSLMRRKQSISQKIF